MGAALRVVSPTGAISIFSVNGQHKVANRITDSCRLLPL